MKICVNILTVPYGITKNSPSFIAMFKTEKLSNVRTLVANRQGIIDIPRTSKYFSQKLFKLNYFTLQS